MANWFKDHPTPSIIGYTFLIASTTWAISYFVIDENKINLYKAQIETKRTELSNQEIITEQYKVKLSIRESEYSDLLRKNQQYESWLMDDSKSFPFLEKKYYH